MSLSSDLNWTQPRRRALTVLVRCDPEPARIGIGMWSARPELDPPMVSSSGAHWLVRHGFAEHHPDDRWVRITEAGRGASAMWAER